MTPGVLQGLKEGCHRIGSASVARGVPPAWFGYRWVPRETVPEYFARQGTGAVPGHRYETVHVASAAENALPCNIGSRDDLPDDRGWWGYSFRDVPSRVSGETVIATIPNARVISYRDPARAHDFYPAILTADDRALDMREVRFRPMHAETLRRSGRPARLSKATWILERVYHNHSHWMTAHLPKLLLLRQRNALAHVLLPPERTHAMDGSLRLAGFEPDLFPTFDPDRPLLVDELTILSTDRFRPELLQLVPEACGVLHAAPPFKRVFISRAKAARRRLVNEEAVWAVLEPAGFERVHMEDLPFTDQAALMRQTAVLCAPHGAGLTNMMLCPPGGHVLEIADLGFPNPNFYALASAMRHHYWVLAAQSHGDGHPLEKDLSVDVSLVEGVLARLAGAGGATAHGTTGWNQPRPGAGPR